MRPKGSGMPPAGIDGMAGGAGAATAGAAAGVAAAGAAADGVALQGCIWGRFSAVRGVNRAGSADIRLQPSRSSISGVDKAAGDCKGSGMWRSHAWAGGKRFHAAAPAALGLELGQDQYVLIVDACKGTCEAIRQRAKNVSVRGAHAAVVRCAGAV